MDLPYLSAEDVERHLTPLVAIDALEAALKDGLDPESDPAAPLRRRSRTAS